MEKSLDAILTVGLSIKMEMLHPSTVFPLAHFMFEFSYRHVQRRSVFVGLRQDTVFGSLPSMSSSLLA
jgi:hypothetical protein